MSKGKSKGGLIFLVLLTYIFFLLMIPVTFGLKSSLLRAEIYVTAILLILSVIFLFGFERPWKAMFCFYILCFINLFVIYTRTWLLKPLAIPVILLLIGLYAAAINLKEDEDDFEYADDDTDVEPYYEEPEVKAEAPKKRPAKRTAKKKTTKRKKK